MGGIDAFESRQREKWGREGGALGLMDAEEMEGGGLVATWGSRGSSSGASGGRAWPSGALQAQAVRAGEGWYRGRRRRLGRGGFGYWADLGRRRTGQAQDE
jgi:hypothetical protein